MKGFAVLCTLGAILIVAAPAAAYVTPPADRTGTHSLIVCVRSGVIGGAFDAKPAITPSTDLWLSLGWGALTPSQVNNFLGAEYGSIVISGYDESTQTIGSAVKSVSWGDPAAKKQTDVSLWTAPFAVNDPTLNGGKPFSMSQFFWNVGSLATGTYWVAPDFELTKAMFDGSNSVPPGQWEGTGCELRVVDH